MIGDLRRAVRNEVNIFEASVRTVEREHAETPIITALFASTKSSRQLMNNNIFSSTEKYLTARHKLVSFAKDSILRQTEIELQMSDNATKLQRLVYQPLG